jgi:hypothetical protein
MVDRSESDISKSIQLYSHKIIYNKQYNLIVNFFPILYYIHPGRY